MHGKLLRYILFMLFMFFIFITSNLFPQKNDNPFSKLSRGDKEQLIKLITDARPFLETAVDVRYEHTLNLFFNRKIYLKLKGNPFLGYVFDEGISIKGNRIKVDCFKSRSGLEPYRRIFERLFREMIRENKRDCCRVVLDEKSPYSLGIFIADVTPKKQDKLIPSVTIELYIKDNRTNRAFFKRFSTGNHQELYHAMRLSIKRIFLTLDYLRSKNV